MKKLSYKEKIAVLEDTKKFLPHASSSNRFLCNVIPCMIKRDILGVEDWDNLYLSDLANEIFNDCIYPQLDEYRPIEKVKCNAWYPGSNWMIRVSILDDMIKRYKICMKRKISFKKTKQGVYYPNFDSSTW